MAKSTNIKDIISKCSEIGDKAHHKFMETDDFTAAKVANQAYTNAVRASLAQLMYKKMTGKPVEIGFLE